MIPIFSKNALAYAFISLQANEVKMYINQNSQVSRL